jgi:hypothetical protein
VTPGRVVPDGWGGDAGEGWAGDAGERWAGGQSMTTDAG